MKRVLILAYDFPPYVSVGGLRPYSWLKYFHEFDIYPIVVTRQWSNKYGNYLDYVAKSESSETITEKTNEYTLIRAPYFPNVANKLLLKYGTSKFAIIRKAISAFYELTQYLFVIGPKASLYSAAKNYLQNNSVDAIIATGDPFILFKYASKLSKKHNTPWIADYRDMWSQNYHVQESFFWKKWHSYFEKKIVTTSSAISTVSDVLKIKISTLIKNKEIFILPNGYDPDAIENVKNIHQGNKELSIAFVGSIYEWNPIRSFLTEITTFIKTTEFPKIKINFYGINLYGASFNSDLSEIIASEFAELSNYINIHKKIANQELLQELATQNVLLLFNHYSLMGTKIFDYIGLKRTILFCYSNDSEATKIKEKYYVEKEGKNINYHLQEDLIKETNSGYIIKDNNHLQEMLKQLYTEFIKNGYIQCETINAEHYSRRHQIKKFAEIIKTKFL